MKKTYNIYKYIFFVLTFSVLERSEIYDRPLLLCGDKW